MKRQTLHLKTILAVGLVARLGVVALVLLRFPKGWLFRSQGELGRLAQSLVEGHGLSSPFGGSTGPTAFLAPGYPAVIAVIFRVFGSFTPASAAAVMLLQTLFGVLTIWVMMWIASREFGVTAANLVGAFWAIGIPFVWLPAVFWETSLTILLMIGAIALALKCVRSPSRMVWVWMGIYGGVTLLVNPSFLLVLVAIFGWVVYQTRGAPRLGPMIGVLVLLAVFMPWPVRNERVLHAFIPLRSNLGFELWKGNRSGASSVDDPELYPATNREQFAEYASKGEMAFMRDKSAAAKQYIDSHPREFLRLSSERLVRFWTGTGATDPSAILAGFAVLTTCLGVVGLVGLVREGRGSLAALFGLPLLLFPLPYYVTHAELRFRMVLEPILSILSADAVLRRWDRLRQRGFKG